MPTYQDNEWNTELCDICNSEIGDAEEHLPHPQECGERHGEDCTCTTTLVVHDQCCTDCHPELEPFETQYASRGHRFLPDIEELVQIPKLYETEDVAMEDKIVHLHYVSPGGEWWIVERDRITNLGFGYACLNDPQNAEWGYVDLTELEALTITVALATPTGRPWPVDVVVDRDREWTPRPVCECEFPGRW